MNPNPKIKAHLIAFDPAKNLVEQNKKMSGKSSKQHRQHIYVTPLTTRKERLL